MDIDNIEYYFEKVISYFFGWRGEENIEDYLFIFEIIKVYYKLTDITFHNKILLTDDFCNKKDNKVLGIDVNYSDNKLLEAKTKEIIKNIKNIQSKNYVLALDPIYSEYINDYNKVIKIPNSLNFKKKYNNKLKDITQNYEYLMVFRPIIYYLLKKKYGYYDYRPYLINLVIELFEIIIKIFYLKIEFFNNKKYITILKRFIINNLLRSPIYSAFSEVLLEKVVNKLLYFSILRLIMRQIISLRKSKTYLF